MKTATVCMSPSAPRGALASSTSLPSRPRIGYRDTPFAGNARIPTVDGFPASRGTRAFLGHMCSGRGAFHFLRNGTTLGSLEQLSKGAIVQEATRSRPRGWFRNGVSFHPYDCDIRYVALVDLGYARVSAVKQDLDRRVEALAEAGIAREQIYVDKKSRATVDRPGLRVVLEYARDGDVIVVHTLDRLGRTVRDTLNLIHELAERGIGVRNLADPIRVDSSRPEDPMAQLAVVLLALFVQMERTYAIERAAQARAVATAEGRRVGRPVLVDPAKLEWAAHLRESGHTIAEIHR